MRIEDISRTLSAKQWLIEVCDTCIGGESEHLPRPADTQVDLIAEIDIAGAALPVTGIETGGCPDEGVETGFIEVQGNVTLQDGFVCQLDTRPEGQVFAGQGQVAGSGHRIDVLDFSYRDF